MLEKVSEMTSEPIVGERYVVDCILYDFGLGWRLVWLPIVGEKHWDKDIGITFEHFHQDGRFTPRKHWSGQRRAWNLNTSYLPENVRGRMDRVMKCLRKMPEFPRHLGSARNREMIRKLEESYIGRKACSTCPHRGMPLDSLPKRKDGTIICNGHGLAIRDGVVVKREAE